MSKFYADINPYSKSTFSGPLRNKFISVVLRKIVPVIVFIASPDGTYRYIAYIILLVCQIAEVVSNYAQQMYYKNRIYFVYRMASSFLSYTLICTGISFLFDKGDIQDAGMFWYYIISLPICTWLEYNIFQSKITNLSIKNYNNNKNLYQILDYYAYIIELAEGGTSVENMVKKESLLKSHKRYCHKDSDDCACNILLNNTDLANQDLWDHFILDELEDKGKRFNKTFEITALKCYLNIEKRNNIYHSLAQVLSSCNKKIPTTQHFQLHRLKMDLEIILHNKDTEQDRKLNKLIEFEDNSYQFMQFVKRSTIIKITLMNMVASDDPQLKQMDRLCNEFVDYQKSIHIYYRILNNISENSAIKITEIYGAYMLQITNDRNASAQVYESLVYSFGLNNQSRKSKDNKESCIIVISGNPEDRGRIVNVNQELLKMLKCKKDEILNKNVNEIMPECYSLHHDKYMEDFLTSGNSTVIGSERKIFFMRKDGYIEKALLYVKIQPDQNLGMRIIGFIFNDQNDRAETNVEALLNNSNKTSLLCYELYSGIIENVNDYCFLNYGINPKVNKDDNEKVHDDKHNMKVICPQQMLKEHELIKLKYGMLIEIDTTFQDEANQQGELDEFDAAYEAYYESDENSLKVEDGDYQNSNGQEDEYHVMQENKFENNNKTFPQKADINDNDSSELYKNDKKGKQNRSFYDLKSNKNKDFENGTKKTDGSKKTEDKASSKKKGTEDAGLAEFTSYRKVTLLARLEHIQQNDSNSKHVFIKLQGLTKFNTNLDNIENFEVNFKTQNDEDTIKKDIKSRQGIKKLGMTQVFKVEDKLLDDDEEDEDEHEDDEGENSIGDYDDEKSIHPNQGGDDNEPLHGSVRSNKKGSNYLINKDKKKRKKDKNKDKDNSEIRKRQIERMKKKHKNFFFLKCSETSSSNMITDDNKEIIETKKNISEKNSSPVVSKLVLFSIIFFATLLLVFLIKLFFRISYISYFNAGINGLYNAYSTAIFLPRVTYYSRYMELIASGITFTGTNGLTRYTEARDIYVKEISLLSINHVNLLGYLNQQGLKREVLPYNITDNRTLSNGNTFQTNDSIYNHYSTYVGQGVTLENANISQLAESTTSGGFYNSIRQSYKYQQTNGYGNLFAYTEILSDNYYDIVEENMNVQNKNILIVFIIEISIMFLSGLLLIPIFIGAEKFNRSIYTLYIMLSVKESDQILVGTKQFLKIYFADFEGEGEDAMQMSRFDIDLSEYSETLGQDNSCGSQSQKNTRTIKKRQTNNLDSENKPQKSTTLRPDLESSLIDANKINKMLDAGENSLEDKIPSPANDKSRIASNRYNNKCVSQNLSDSRFHGSMPSDDRSNPNINQRNFDNIDDQPNGQYLETDGRIMTTEGNVDYDNASRLITEGEVLMTETKDDNYENKQGLLNQQLADSHFTDMHSSDKIVLTGKAGNNDQANKLKSYKKSEKQDSRFGNVIKEQEDEEDNEEEEEEESNDKECSGNKSDDMVSKKPSAKKKEQEQNKKVAASKKKAEDSDVHEDEQLYKSKNSDG